VSLERAVVYAQVAVGTSLIAFGGLNWALDGAAAPVAAVLRLRESTRRVGALTRFGDGAAGGLPAAEIRFRDVSFSYPRTERKVLRGLDLTIPAGSSLAIVGQNGAGKATLAKLLCRLYDPKAGAIEVDGTDLRDLDVAAWRSRVAAVFQDFTRFDLSLRDNSLHTALQTRMSSPRWRPPGPTTWPRSTPFCRRSTPAASTSPGASGSGWRWPAPCAPYAAGPGWCCSTSPPPSSTCAGRRRSSVGCSTPLAG